MKDDEKLLPATVIGSVFRLRRDLTRVIKEDVISGSGMSLEQADLLLDLYGARYLDWAEPKHDKDGYVTFEALKRSLAHSQALLSRKIADLEELGLVKTERVKDVMKVEKGHFIDGKKKCLRITDEGRKRIKPVHESFNKCCEEILKEISPEDQQKLYDLNEILIKKLHRRSR